MFEAINTNIPEVKILKPSIYEDDRGFFYESFNQNDFNSAIGDKVNFVQDNHSRSKHLTLRGLHYQEYPYEQGKLVRVLVGEIFDVALDYRKNSKTYGEYVGIHLSSENKKQLWIPPGFAHGFLVLSNNAEIAYKTTNYYSPDHDKGFFWQSASIDWPVVKDLTLSDKDKNLPNFITHEI